MTVTRCDACRHVQHQRCIGRQFCACLICYRRVIMADARARAAAGDRLMAEMLAINTQRTYLADKARKAVARYYGGCHCGCGEQVWGVSWGAPRRYVNATHARRAQYQRDRKKQRDRERKKAA